MVGITGFDAGKDLVTQFIEIITGEIYKLRALPETITSKTIVSTIPSPTTVTVASPPSPLSPVSEADFKAMMQKLKEQEEAFRKQQEELEAHKKAQQEKALAAEEREKAIAEELAQVKKQIPKPKPMEEGGTEAVAYETPHSASGAHVSTEHAHILSQHDERLRVVTEKLEIIMEKQEHMSSAVYGLQDKTGIKRGPKAKQELTQVQFMNVLEAEKRQQEQKTKAAAKKTVGIDSLV